jgi:hypothetical protein
VGIPLKVRSLVQPEVALVLVLPVLRLAALQVHPGVRVAGQPEVLRVRQAVQQRCQVRFNKHIWDLQVSYLQQDKQLDKLEYRRHPTPCSLRLLSLQPRIPCLSMPAGLGAIGATVGGALTPEMPGMPKTKYDGPLSKFAYDPRKYRRQMAGGGLADTAVAQRMMRGGHLGSYSDGGRLLKGPGDGMSDDIPAKIGRKQPARLADGEFVVPADVVSGIGNGSTDAGAKRLYQMMDRVRSARTGSKKQGREIKAEKYLPT